MSLRRTALLGVFVAGCAFRFPGSPSPPPEVCSASAPAGHPPSRLVYTRCPDRVKPTVVLVRGAGRTSDLQRLADSIAGRANTALYLYENTEPLSTSARGLRREVRRLAGPVVIVAHSMGGLVTAYLGATTGADETRCLGAVYLNPLIGGSRYAEGGPWLGWLSPLRPFLQRVFFPRFVQDLVPSSDFEQTIFGPASRRSSFADRAVVLFTEAPGDEPDISDDWARRAFGSPRSALIAQLGRADRVEWPLGHTAPLDHPEIVVPLIDGVLGLVGDGARDPARAVRCAAAGPS